jgi:hypothetical protein
MVPMLLLIRKDFFTPVPYFQNRKVYIYFSIFNIYIYYLRFIYMTCERNGGTDTCLDSSYIDKLYLQYF